MNKTKYARKATYIGPEYHAHAHRTRYRHGKPVLCKPEDSRPYRNKHAECLPGQFSLRERLGLTFDKARAFARLFRSERAA
jgi:hypothetical protein